MPVAIPLALGAIEAGIGLVNSAKAKKEAGILEKTRPTRETSPLIGQNLSLAESELGTGGLSASAQNAYDQQSNRQFSSSIDAILKGGGDVNNIANVFDTSEQGRLRIAQLSDQLRLNKINQVIQARNASAEEADKNLIFNKYAPWADKSQANAIARQNANNLILQGANTFGAGVSNFSAGNNQNNQFSNYLKTLNSGGSGNFNGNMGGGGGGNYNNSWGDGFNQ